MTYLYLEIRATSKVARHFCTAPPINIKFGQTPSEAIIISPDLLAYTKFN